MTFRDVSLLLVDELVAEELERVKTSFDSPDSTSTFEEYLERRELGEEAFTGEIRESISHRVRRSRCSPGWCG